MQYDSDRDSLTYEKKKGISKYQQLSDGNEEPNSEDDFQEQALRPHFGPAFKQKRCKEQGTIPGDTISTNLDDDTADTEPPKWDYATVLKRLDKRGKEIDEYKLVGMAVMWSSHVSFISTHHPQKLARTQQEVVKLRTETRKRKAEEPIESDTSSKRKQRKEAVEDIAVKAGKRFAALYVAWARPKHIFSDIQDSDEEDGIGSANGDDTENVDDNTDGGADDEEDNEEDNKRNETHKKTDASGPLDFLLSADQLVYTRQMAQKFYQESSMEERKNWGSKGFVSGVCLSHLLFRD